MSLTDQTVSRNTHRESHGYVRLYGCGWLGAIGVLCIALIYSVLALPATASTQSPGPGSLQIVATSGIVADLVKQVAQERAEVQALLRPGADPHTYQPLPADVRAVSRAEVFALHGAGLDTWAEKLVKSSETKARVVTVTKGLQARVTQDGEADPHYWFDPKLVEVYVQNILEALIAADPRGASVYKANAAAFAKELKELDAWILAMVSKVPPEQRKLVTNHDSFQYFAARYGFRVVGTVVPGFNPEAEPSARQLAALVNTIRREDVNAIFTESTANANLAQAITSRAGKPVRVVRLYTGSLSQQGGPADTYLNLMRYNVRAIIEGIQ